MHRKFVRSFSVGLVVVTALGALFVYRTDVLRDLGVTTTSAAASNAKATPRHSPHCLD